MRVLFAANPEKAIFRHMVPLAWALRTAGHEVLVASQPSLTDTITEAGLTAVPLGRNSDHWRIVRIKHPETVEEQRKGMPEPLDMVERPELATWEHAVTGYDNLVQTAHRHYSFPIITALVEFARYWRPELIIWEPFTYAGPIAAKACGAAHARLPFGIDAFGVAREMFLRLKDQQTAGQRTDPLADWLGGYARKYGGDYTEDMATGHFTLDHFPASLQIEAENLSYVRMQYIPYGGPSTIPKWLWKPPAKPRVALTMGITATEIYDGYTVDMQDVLDHLGELDIEVVATVADAEKERLARIPSNTRVVPFVPWQALVPTCSVVVHHAAAATLATTARYPVPHLSLHYHFDQPLLGRKVTEQGAGLDLHTSEATGESVRDCVVRLLEEPRFKERAVALTEEIQALPTPNAIVPELEELTAKYRTR